MEHVGHVKLMLMEVVGSVRERVQRMERWEHVKRRLLFVVQTARVILVVLAHKCKHEVIQEVLEVGAFTENLFLQMYYSYQLDVV